MLGPYRVLDLTNELGSFAGFTLAHFGADVVLAEPPGGWPRDSRFDAYHRGKRSVIIDGQATLDTLVAEADVVVVDGIVRDGQLVNPLAEAAGVELDLDGWRDADPALITATITPWGSTGPKAEWLANDLTLVASSGQMAVTGDDSRPPVRISIPQTWCHAGAQAAVGIVLALTDRAETGLGQHVDVSAQQAACETAVPAINHAPAGLPPVQRFGGGIRFGREPLKMVYETLDGHTVITVSFGPMIGPMLARFMHWVHEEGFCDDALRDKDYVNFALNIMEGREPVTELRRLLEVIGQFAATKTKAELLEKGLSESFLIAPVSTLQDVLDSPQLAARDFWQTVEAPAGGAERHPGPMVKASRSPLQPTGPAPAPGSGTTAAWGSRRLDKPRPTGADPRRRPLEGIRVCDLAWVAAAPLTTKILAHWGAEVIRFETVNRPCLLRGALGHRDDIPDQENAITWHSVNANKKTVALDLSKPESRQVVRDLVAVSDIVLESFTPGTVGKWGLGYDELAEINPSLIMASSCVMGQTGPYRDFAGFGNMSASVAGFFDITGWPDLPPAGPYMAYTDYTSPRFTAVALLAALDHRRRTGEGQYLDFSQMEAATHFLTPALLELQRGGEMITRRGNSDPAFCPHSVYPAWGDDVWVAVACDTDEQWRSLAIEMRRPDLADLSFAERKVREAEIDELIGAWTRKQDADGVAIRLQAHGVPAHRVSNTGECFSDPQLVHRKHFQWVPHAEVRRALVDGMPYTLSRSSGGFDWAGPMYGEYTMEVLMDILGYDGDRIAELAVAEALE